MKPLRALLTAAVFALSVFAADRPALPTAHTTRNVEGWNVRVDDRLLTGGGATLGERALKLLSARLTAITFVVPAPALATLRTVTIQLDLNYGELRPMQYHPSRGWLKEKGYSEALAKCVHIPSVEGFLAPFDIHRMPWVVLHELAHAYHDQVLGFEEPRLLAAWENFRASGKYKSVLTSDGAMREHYGLNNAKEFFAEMTESYFGSNDFYPFVAGELKQTEPELFVLLAAIWGPLPNNATPRLTPKSRRRSCPRKTRHPIRSSTTGSTYRRARVSPLLALVAVACAAQALAVDFPRLRDQVTALGHLTSPPAVHAAEGFAATGPIKPIFFEGLAYQGTPTRVFAWLGLPQSPSGKVPGVVLVHGGGGTAFKEWVQKWNEQGFAAISIAVEGQTDERIPGAPPGAQWQRHATAGPARHGIYGDSAEPLANQWMYHAVADTVLAHSLLRSLPEVDAARVGVCGISWGGIITSTVVGIDARFAFGIPIYGCGALDRAAENYVRALRDNTLYREVWEPLLRLPRATMPLLWLTGPRDAHFPLDVQQASYRAAPGPRMVSIPFDMKHSHPAGWNPPDSYAFAKSIVETGRPWAREVSQEIRDGVARVTFDVMPAVSTATLISKRDADWEKSPAQLKTTSGRVTASARLPAGTTTYYFNIEASGLTVSSEYQPIALPSPNP